MINSFNTEFSKLLNYQDNSKNNFVLGLSGGLDSMVLLYSLKNFIDKFDSHKIKIFPVIIDHNLRSESSDEAKAVQEISKKIGFQTSIKKIVNNKPNGNIQDWARRNRRDLLFESCSILSANLLLAHHFDDQAETLFMRFTKNSGLDGLIGMKSISFWNGIFILRPFLNFSKNQIYNYAINNNIKYFEDSSNYLLKYERVRVRYLLNNIKTNVWKNISKDLNRFGVVSSNLITKINILFNDWIKQNAIIDKCGGVRLCLDSTRILFEKSDIFCIKFFIKIIQTVGGKEYPPKRKQVRHLINSLFIMKFKKHTLGNVCVFLKQNYIYFLREQRNLHFNTEIKKNKKYIFDGRFIISSSASGTLISSETGNHNNISDKSPFYDYKRLINNTIPCIQTLEGKLIKPHLKIIDEKTKINTNEIIKPNSFKLYLINRVLI